MQYAVHCSDQCYLISQARISDGSLAISQHAHVIFIFSVLTVFSVSGLQRSLYVSPRMLYFGKRAHRESVKAAEEAGMRGM